MLKRISAALLCLAMLLTVSACNIKKDKDSAFESAGTSSATKVSTTAQNFLKDIIPEFDFKESPAESFNGSNYTFTVECSEREYKKYIKALKKSGFEKNMVDETGYFYAFNSENYLAEVIYIEKFMTVKIENR